MSDTNGGHDTHHGNYVKIWAILVVLLAISVLGPTLGIPVVTLLTAFGIAVVKAFLVVKHFMHLTVQPRFVAYMVSTALAFMALFFYGAAPDIMNHEGANWEKPLEIAAATEYEARLAAGDDEGGDEHGDSH